MAANLHWGGEDFRTLFVCATRSVYMLTTKIGPRNEPFMRVARPPASTAAEPSAARASSPEPADGLRLDPARCALIIQDMQNDVVMDGGAFAASGSPQHCREQRSIENIRRLAEACRARGVMVIHVWFLVEPGAPGMTLNAPLFEGLVDAGAHGPRQLGRRAGAGPRAAPGRPPGGKDAHERLRGN